MLVLPARVCATPQSQHSPVPRHVRTVSRISRYAIATNRNQEAVRSISSYIPYGTEEVVSDIIHFLGNEIHCSGGGSDMARN